MEPLRETDDTFCIALLGDFLGEDHGNPGEEAARWVPRRATPETVMKLLGLQPRVRAALPGAGGDVEVRLRRLEDFHPETLFQELELFAPFREARIAAREGRPLPPPFGDPGATAGHEPPIASTPSSGNLLESILDVAQPPESGALLETPEQLQAFVQSVVRPHLVRPDEDAPGRVARVDAAAGELLSALLHAPAFRELEAIWRSLVFLLSRVDSAGKVRVYAVHLPRRVLLEDLSADVPLTRTRLFSLLAGADLGAPARRWGVAVGAYGFGSDPRDAAILSRLGSVAEGAGVPWFSSFEPEDRGAPSESPPEWDALRAIPGALSLSLTHPRFLVREPYQAPRRPPKVLAFTESDAAPGNLPWGPGGVLAAALLGQAHAGGRKSLNDLHRDELELSGMPLLPSDEGADGGAGSTERLLDPDEAVRLLELGVIPVLSFPSQATVRLGGVRPLASEWGS